MQTQTPRSVLTTARIVHFAMLTSVGIYFAVIVLVLRPKAEAVGPGLPALDPFAIALAAVALVDVVLAWVLPGILSGEERLKAAMLGTEGDRLAAAFAVALQGFIIRLALLEAVAIFGLVLAFQYQDPRFFYPFAVVSAAAMLVSRFDHARVTDVYSRLALERGWPQRPLEG